MADLLLFKLLVTPLLILMASLAGRRWGESVGGWFVGLPLTSGPVCLFLALEQGPGFAARSTLGSIAGVAAEAGFCLVYARTAQRAGWPAALAAGSLAFIAAAALLSIAGLSLWPLVGVAVAALVVALLRLPRLAPIALAVAGAPPRWDIPARMMVATTLVIALTEAAPLLGPRLSGLTASYPVFAAVLTAFAHRARGTAAGIAVLRGLMIGLFAFTAFFVVLNRALEPLGIVAGFIAATVTALAVQALSLWSMHRLGRPS